MASSITISDVAELNEVVSELRAGGNIVKVQKTETGFLVNFDKGGVPMTPAKPKFKGYCGFSGRVPFGSQKAAQAEYDRVKPQYGDLVQLKGSALVYMTSSEVMMNRAGII